MIFDLPSYYIGVAAGILLGYVIFYKKKNKRRIKKILQFYI